MTTRVDHELCGDGVRITRMSSTDRILKVPEEIGGLPVTSIGPGILRQSPGSNGRTLRIPSSVTSVDPGVFDGARGVGAIEYGGELSVFGTFGLVLEWDCVLRCLSGGRPFEFTFPSRTPMSFPEFDDEMFRRFIGMTPDIALTRLSEPYGLTEENRARYERYVSDKVVPQAERAASAGDAAQLRRLLSTGLVSDGDVRRLMERSVRSGRIAVTSMLMSELNRRSARGKGSHRAPAPPDPRPDPGRSGRLSASPTAFRLY